MNNSIQLERYQWIKLLLEKKVTYAEVLSVCPHSKRSLERWVRAYKKEGMEGLIPKSTELKTQPNETPIRIKEEVIPLRKKTGLCALKLHWRLKKRGTAIPSRTVGKILKKEGLVHTYRVKKVRYKCLRAERQRGELLEMDVKYVPRAIQGHHYFQYTVIDTASRWRRLEVFDEQSTYNAIRMMEIVMERFPYTIQGLPIIIVRSLTTMLVRTNDLTRP